MPFFLIVVSSVGKNPKETKIMNESNKNNNTQETASREVPRDLPELDEADVVAALSHQNLSWAHGFMDAYRTGETLWVEGVHIQKVTEDTVRCIAVVDHWLPFSGLMMMKVAFEAANIELELAPYTLVMPYIAVEEGGSGDDNGSVPGLEVA
jgi:hypothetical protein